MNLPYDLNKTGKAAAMFLLLYCVAEVAMLWHYTTLFSFYTLIETGNLNQLEMDQAAAEVDATGAAVGALFLLTLLGSYIAAGMWIYRAAANAQAIAPAEGRITPGWSIGWFFVPFANLVMPFRAMRQTWNGLHGNPSLTDGMPGWTLIWWLAWLLSNSLATGSMRINMNADSIADFRLSTQIDVASSIIAIGTALLFRHLILQLTRASAQASASSQS